MTYFYGYLLALAFVPLAARLKWNSRAAVVAVIAELGLVLIVTVAVLAAAAIMPGIWPHSEYTAALPTGRSVVSTSLEFLSELAALLWRTTIIPAAAAIIGGALTMLCLMCEGYARYAIGRRRRRRKRLALGSKGY